MKRVPAETKEEMLEEMFQTLKYVQQTLSRRQITREAFMELMGEIKRTILRGERILKLLGVLLMVALPASAWEKPKNPDRIPSIGVDLWKGQLAGMDRQLGMTNGGTVGFAADYRMPISSTLTLNPYGETESVNNNLRFTEGYKIGIKVRVYIQD